MNSTVLRLHPAIPQERTRNALIRLVGWRALVWQQDPPTYDRWRWVRKHLVAGPLRTLDAGSGSGAFTMYAAVQGNEALGLSFDEDANRLASLRATMLGLERVQFRTADLRALDAIAPELGQFDQILCLETIEHIIADQKLIRDLARLLRPGGTLLLTTPFSGHRPLLGERLSTAEDGGHVRWGYTLDELQELFANADLRLRSHEYLSGVVTQQITNAARILGDKVGVRGAWAVTAALRLLRVIDGPLSRRLHYPALAIAVVGVKR